MAYEIEIQTTPFTSYDFYIDEEKVSFHDTEMLMEEVVGVTWYINEVHVHGINLKNYHFRIMDEAGDEINFSFSNGMISISATDTYNAIVENIRRYIGGKLFKQIYENLLEGISTDLERCTLLPQGLSFTTKSLFGSPKDYIIPWEFLNYTYDERFPTKHIDFYSNKDPKAKMSLNTKLDLNAVVLMHFSDWLKRPWERIKEIYRKNNIPF